LLTPAAEISTVHGPGIVAGQLPRGLGDRLQRVRVVADDQLGDRLGHELEAVGVARAGRRLPLPGGEAGLECDRLALRGEEDAGQPRAELPDEPSRDLRSERLRPDDLARHEV